MELHMKTSDSLRSRRGAMRPTARRASAQRRGVTLIELLVVITLIGIIAGMSYPRLNLQKYHADAAARVVRGTMQQAQRLAVQRQYDVIVSFDQVNRRVRLLEDQDNDSTADANERVVYRPLEEGSKFGTPPRGVFGGTATWLREDAPRTSNGLPSVIFHRDGATSGAIEVYVTSASGRAQDFRAITLVQSTARTEWYRWTGTTWKEGGL